MASTFRERQLPPAEVRRILRRAAEIAEADPETAAVERPLTQDELTRKAADLGLPASAVERAIEAPSAPEPSGDGPWLRPRTVLLEQEISGELPPERHEEVIDAIRAAAGSDGRTEVLGKTLTWSFSPQMKPLVTIRSKDGRTQVRVEQPLNGALVLTAFAVLGLLPTMMTGALAMDLSHSGRLATVVGAVTMVCALVASTLFAEKTVRRREALLHRVMERATLAVSAAVQASAPPVRARIAKAAVAGEAPSAAQNSASAEEAEAEAEAADAEVAKAEMG
jgi:hypothetical protein